MNFRVELEAKRAYIDSLIAAHLEGFYSPSGVLASSVNYSVGSGGKRLRAILSHEFFCTFLGKIDRGVEMFLVAIEILHLYTLVHDDMPCMDNDDFRRGQPSTHKAFGESMALLCGDALLNFSYELILRGAEFSQQKQLYLPAAAYFSRCAGAAGVIGGQALEFERERIVDERHAYEIYKHKTCDLIRASVVCGAILAGAKNEAIRDLESFAYHFGIAFQLRDDFLDIKEKGIIEKNSLLGLIGEKNANIILEESVDSALKALDRLQIRSDFLQSLTKFAALRSN